MCSNKHSQYSFVLLNLSLLSFNSHRDVYASTLQNLVDVKSNDAIREIRILYDIDEPVKPVEQTPLYLSNNYLSTHHPLNTSYSSTFQNRHSFYKKFLSPYNAHQIPRQFQLIRGRPLYAEIDFVPRYIPAETAYVAVSVELPAHIRGRKWILGWHREQFSLPKCRLCTNQVQSYTLPVTLFLADDGWCPEGQVPTIWKIEALPISAVLSSLLTQSSSSLLSDTHARMSRSMGAGGDQTDTILALAYDERRQIRIVNHANSSVNCRGISEAIIA